MGVGISIFLEYFRSPLPLLLTLSDRPAQHCGAKAVRGAPTLHGRRQDAGRGPHPGDPGRAARRPADRGHVTPAGQSGAAGRPSAEQGLLRHNKHKQEQLGAATPSRHALPAARGPGAGRAGGANFAPRREQQAPTPAVGNAAPAQRDAPRSPHGPNNSASKLGLHVGRVDAEPRGRDADPSARSPGAPPTARRARRCGGGGADETRGGGGGVSRAKLSVAGRRGLPCRGGPVSPAARLGAAPARSRGVAAVVVAAAAGLRGGGGPTAAAAPGPHKEQTARLVAQQPGRRARPEGPGAAALGPRDGRSGEQALPAWAPTRGRAPSASKPPDPSESLLSPHGPRAQPPPRDLP